MTTDMLIDKKFSPIVIELFIRGMKLNIFSCFCLISLFQKIEDEIQHTFLL